jgi:hypothetical protein
MTGASRSLQSCRSTFVAMRIPLWFVSILCIIKDVIIQNVQMVPLDGLPDGIKELGQFL